MAARKKGARRKPQKWISRFWARIDIGGLDDCWPWLGAKHSHGYGQLVISGKRLYAHRVAYELSIGPIPEGYEIDHVKVRGCHKRSCCNPAHLEAVTPEENKLRSGWDGVTNARKTYCKRGHPYTPENTGINKRGHRYCKACQRVYATESRRRKKQVNLEAQYEI